jgi:hypothetical protein
MARSIKSYGIYIMVAVIAGALTLKGCSDDDNDVAPRVDEIAIHPESASFGVGEQQEFSAFFLTAAGDTVDVADLDVELQWWSTDPDVFTVVAGGTATGHDSGEAFCVVQATVFVGSRNFTGRDSAFVVIF